MQIIKLDATDSTSSYLKNLISDNILDDFTVVVSKKQLNGRGQMGTVWDSEEGKNLTFSILKKINSLPVVEQFVVNMKVSLAVYEVLHGLKVPDLKVKWPNDILSGNDKICGILIENMLSGKNIQSSIVGIGLNVNQIVFHKLPNVSSLKLILGQTFNLDEILTLILKNLKKSFSASEAKSMVQLKSEYEAVLFRKDKPSTFKNQKDELFMGFIRGVSANGKLEVILEDNILQEFDLKEIKLLY
ncbi:BirA family biotin operon repressor/biotin-[acetyl-CoA-carboxylase] ligase [Saonia flava]|uniref:BirA family biotin operon repressor/biotin-[acetyl-CoA-carboxylase] ligase n=1 Tax=Saonia flava TaxID=523696 RepID=A0A846QWQ8_9FLAO|nr:biotin--[acetyl-CoA-carboxylase] ligase [Saonia flava]NJB70703.1 BirA family biotin operon repressor/biotin-[acetyl-CoA-carboxylase] ligase [Saonia flava]